MITLILTLTLLFLVLLIGYTLLLNQYHRALQEMKPQPANSDTIPLVSVIIPARNEAQNIANCLKALFEQDFPSSCVEILVIDDHSTDDTARIAAEFPVKVIRLADFIHQDTLAFKKMAITKGIEAAKGEIILTTDADCVAPKGWIRSMTEPIRNNHAIMTIGGVRMVSEDSYISKFQALDFAILQGITAAAVSSRMHDMASGANLAYTRAVFYEVNGFDGVDDIASGDDMLLMQKISARYDNSIQYVSGSDSIVETKTEPDLKSFFRQRIRWASKTSKYKSKKLLRILAMVYFLNLAVFSLMVLAPFNWIATITALACIALKTLTEWRFIKDVLYYFKLSSLLVIFLPSQPLHIIYTVVSGTFGLFGTVQWKGRKVK